MYNISECKNSDLLGRKFLEDDDKLKPCNVSLELTLKKLKSELL